MSYNMSLAINFVVVIPQALVAALGAVLALVVRKRLGKAVVPALIGFALLAIAAVVGVSELIFDSQVSHLAVDHHWSAEQINAYFLVFSVSSGLLMIAGLAVLVIATVIRRGTEPPAADRPAPAYPPAPQPGFAPPSGQPGQPGQPAGPQPGGTDRPGGQFQPGAQGQAPFQPPQGPSPY